MKKTAIAILLAACIMPNMAQAQLNLGRLIQGGVKAVKALTLSDQEIIGYVDAYIQKTDSANVILGPDTEYGKRLDRLTSGLTSVEGIPLNFKVYKNSELNAFACANGNVRVYSGLMDAMTDDEVLGVIGHEIGHVAHHDTKNAFKQALLNDALKDGLASTSSKVANLTDSQYGALGAALASSKFSRKQETAADDYGYDFLKSNGKNPAAMALAFQRLQAFEQQAGAQTNMVNQLFSSHPDIAKRIKHMVDRCKKDGYVDANGNLVVTQKTEETVSSSESKTTKTTKKTTKSKTTSATKSKSTKTNTKSTSKTSSKSTTKSKASSKSSAKTTTKKK